MKSPFTQKINSSTQQNLWCHNRPACPEEFPSGFKKSIVSYRFVHFITLNCNKWIKQCCFVNSRECLVNKPKRLCSYLQFKRFSRWSFCYDQLSSPLRETLYPLGITDRNHDMCAPVFQCVCVCVSLNACVNVHTYTQVHVYECERVSHGVFM